MEAQYEEINRWKNWSLEDTCCLLREKFPGASIWIVRPSTMLRYLFACFHNFVKSSIIGVPEYAHDHGALPHLFWLLRDAIKQVVKGGGVRISKEAMFSLPLILIGFSKGCVVLNQLVHELGKYVHLQEEAQGTSNIEQLRSFVHQIKAIYWLDAGHSGEKEAWVTDDHLLDHLAALGAKVRVHVTPHQVKCPARPWIGEEEKAFVTKLKKRGVDVEDTLHFGDDERSLEKHFRVLDAFNQ